MLKIKETIELLLYKLEQNYKCEKENYFILYKPDIKDLLDYITNLQQEIQKKDSYIKYLEEYNPKYYKGEKFYGDSREELQQRIDKAMEYIENTPKVVKSIHIRDKESNYVFVENEIRLELLNILKGDDENEER